MDKKHRLNWDA
jgi:CBS domain-containing protein